MKIIKTDIPEVLLLKPYIYKDQRGSFFESFNKQKYKQHLNNIDFIQDNESVSSYGVLRGLHFQKFPHEQAKLIRVVKGKIQDVAIDIRPDSPTFKKYISVELSNNNNYQLFIPKGFAHGFVVLSKEAIVSYKVDSKYNLNADSGYKYDDPSFNIKWLIDEGQITLSEKDQNLPYIK